MGLVAGQKVAERFRILYPLGAGGQGTVYAAWDDAAGRAYALKVLGGRGSPARQRREGELRRRLDAQSVVPVHDPVHDPEHGLVLVMDLVEGCSLAALLRELELTDAEGLAVFAAIARALGEVHARGVIHRDLKPSNVMLDVHDGRVRARLTDFGSARAEGTDPLTLTGDAVGTLRYAAPEQLLDGASADERADLYALGVILRDLAGDSGSGGALAQALTRKERDERPRGVPEVLADLGEVDAAPLAADGRIGRLVRVAAERSSTPTEGTAPGGLGWASRGLVAGLVGSAVVTMLRIGYDALPTSPEDPRAPALLLQLPPPPNLALPGPEACADLVRQARDGTLPMVTLPQVLMWTAFAWAGMGYALGAGLEALARLRLGRPAAPAFLLGAACFLLAHQLPARDARVEPFGVLRVDVREGAAQCVRWGGGPLAEPDLEALTAAVIGGFACAHVVSRRAGWEPRTEMLAMLRVGLAACGVAIAVLELSHQAGLTGLPGVPRWAFHLQFPHPDRVLLWVAMGMWFVAALRMPLPRG